MFSSNGKISPRQLKRLLILDFFGKGAVLLPTFGRDMGSREFIFSLIAVLLFMLVYAELVRKLSVKVKGNFYRYLERCLGKGTAVVLTFLFFLYALFNLVYIIRIFGNLGSSYILTEERPEPLMILALLAGLYAALGGGEVRGRVAETLYPILFFPILFLLLYCAFHVRPDYVAEGAVRLDNMEQRSLMEMFSVFGGVGFYLFLAPGVGREGEENYSHSELVKGMGQTAAALLALFVIIAGAFGENGIRKLRQPVVTLMSSAKLPGVFLERWDVIFAGFLMTMLFVSTATSIHYLIILGKVLFSGCSKRTLGWIFSGAAFVLALILGDSERSARAYIFVNSFVAVPVWVVLVIMLLCLERTKGRRKVCGE